MFWRPPVAALFFLWDGWLPWISITFLLCSFIILVQWYHYLRIRRFFFGCGEKVAGRRLTASKCDKIVRLLILNSGKTQGWTSHFFEGLNSHCSSFPPTVVWRVSGLSIARSTNGKRSIPTRPRKSSRGSRNVLSHQYQKPHKYSSFLYTHPRKHSFIGVLSQGTFLTFLVLILTITIIFTLLILASTFPFQHASSTWETRNKDQRKRQWQNTENEENEGKKWYISFML